MKKKFTLLLIALFVTGYSAFIIGNFINMDKVCQMIYHKHKENQG